MTTDLVKIQISEVNHSKQNDHEHTWIRMDSSIWATSESVVTKLKEKFSATGSASENTKMRDM